MDLKDFFPLPQLTALQWPRLSDDDATIRSATVVARAARMRVLATLPDVIRDIDMDLEDEGGNNPWDAAAGQEVRHRRPEAFFFSSPPPPRNRSLTTGFHILSFF